MKRILLFILTNLAVLALLSVVLFIVENVFGVHLLQGGTGGLLGVAAIFGFGGSLISLALSKWTAKRMMGVRTIDRPDSELERWLVGAVKRLAEQAEVAMPEVGIFRLRGNECLRHRRPAQRGLGGREQRTSAQHVANTSGSGTGSRNLARGER